MRRQCPCGRIIYEKLCSHCDVSEEVEVETPQKPKSNRRIEKVRSAFAVRPYGMRQLRSDNVRDQDS